MFSLSIFLSAPCHLQSFYTPVSSKHFPRVMSVRVAIFESQNNNATREQIRLTRTRQNADKPNTDSDCFGIYLFFVNFFSTEMIVINHGFQFLFHGNPHKRERITPPVLNIITLGLLSIYEFALI